MLRKLLKYDMLAMVRPIVAMCAILIGYSVITRGVMELSNLYPIFGIISSMMLFGFVLLLIGTFVFTFGISIERFYSNLIKDEGYLTHTLPVKKSSIILAKLISATCYIVVSTVVAMVALLIVFYQPSMMKTITDLLQKVLVAEMGFSPWIAFGIVIFSIFVSYINQLLLFYVAIALGQLKNRNKVIYSVVYGAMLYSANQILSMLLLGVFLLMDSTLFTRTVFTPEQAGMIIGVALLFSVVVCVVYYFVTEKLLTKKLNLE